MWDQKDCVDYLKTSAVLAAYIDQSLSTNTFYSPRHFKDGKVPGTLIAKNLMLAYKWGLKTMYYSLIDKVGSKNILMTQSDRLVALEPVTIYSDDEDCEACKL
jgi:ribonucleotide reductase alpha subunit